VAQSIGSSNGSPVMVNGIVYQIDDTGVLNAVKADSGEIIWTLKMATGNVHAFPIYVDGLLYVPQLDGRLAVVKPGEKAGEIVKDIKLSGQCLGAPAVANGVLYIHTTEKFYAFEIKSNGITNDEVPAAVIPSAGKPAALQIVPAEVVLTPGTSKSFRIRRCRCQWLRDRRGGAGQVGVLYSANGQGEEHVGREVQRRW